MRVFFTLCIGDITTHTADLAAYDRLRAWMDKYGATYGWTLEDLGEEERETVKEIWEAEKGLREQGPILFEPPPPLPGGKVVIELDAVGCPKTSENFRQLCVGGRVGRASRKALHYKGTKMFRIVRGVLAQGGDVTRGDGSGGDSIYNGKFNDELAGLAKKFARRGQVGMANSGRNSNTSQFFITLTDDTAALARISGKYVLFGEIVEGGEVIEALTAVPVKDETPLLDIVVVDCGEVV